ncbi:MAG TPA: hypothetical protein VGD56_15355 [Gemmatirosa sp.]
MPTAAADAVAIDMLATPGADALGFLTGRVRDAAGRAVVAAGRWQGLGRAYPTLDVGEATRAELELARTQLCDAVSVLAAHMRRDGLPPQRMLVVVKDAVRAALTPVAADAPGTRDVMNDAVRCGIDAYYAAA